MRIRLLLLTLIVAGSLYSVAEVAQVGQAQDAGKRYAVVVGIKEYDHPKLTPLKYPPNDAKALRDVLNQSGYQVTLLTAEAGENDSSLLPTKGNITAQVKRV